MQLTTTANALEYCFACTRPLKNVRLVPGDEPPEDSYIGNEMAKLDVGMLVRIRWSLTWPCLNGQQGRIVAKIPEAHRCLLPEGHTGEWEVAPDAWGGSASPDGLGFFFPAGEQLELVDPEGMRLAAWEDCEWQPDDAFVEINS